MQIPTGLITRTIPTPGVGTGDSGSRLSFCTSQLQLQAFDQALVGHPTLVGKDVALEPASLPVDPADYANAVSPTQLKSAGHPAPTLHLVVLVGFAVKNLQTTNHLLTLIRMPLTARVSDQPPPDGPRVLWAHQQPLVCETEKAGLGEPTDEACRAETRSQYSYLPAGRKLEAGQRNARARIPHCASWMRTYSPSMVKPHSCPGALPSDLAYDLERNPDGARCGCFDNVVNLIGCQTLAVAGIVD